MLEKLTKEQEAKLEEYKNMGIEIGLATYDPEVDMNKVRTLIDRHREACGVGKTKNFRVYDSPMAAMDDPKNKGITPYNALYGQHDINWLIYYSFYLYETEVTGMEPIVPLLELAKMVGWMWVGETDTIITHRPTRLHMIGKPAQDGGTIKVLHNYNGKALEYLDGNGVYAINGTRIPSEYTHMVDAYAGDIDVRAVLGISNTEVRTELLKKIGVERAFSSLDKKQLDVDTVNPGGKYELYTVDFGEGAQRTYLTGVCPSNDEAFYEAVHPDCKTVKQALHWRNWGTITTDVLLPEELT